MNFQHLEVWQLSRELRIKAFRLTQSFPESEKYKLSDQLIRSSRSITANIAEGAGRYHFQENMQFCRVSRGSLAETLDHFTCALDCGYIAEKEYAELEALIERVYRLLNGYIGYLKKQKLS